MTPEYILNEVKREKRIGISTAMVNNIPEFKTGQVVTSFESLALELSGHQPIKEQRFDINKFQSWCGENSLRVYFDDRERTVHLELDSIS